jgi:N-glycosylase/DNA lyase
MSTHLLKKNNRVIRQIYHEIAGRIDGRLAEFRSIWEKGDDACLFIELVFCLLTPQSGARRCWQAVENLNRKGLIFNGGREDICKELNIVRFKNNKTSYILEARGAFMERGGSLRKVLVECRTNKNMREWLARNVKGLGYKEASHYLRNIGQGEDLAILDRHIIRCMAEAGLIEKVPQSISPRLYLELENILRGYSRRLKIPMSHLDYILWYKQTGDLFK